MVSSSSEDPKPGIQSVPTDLSTTSQPTQNSTQKVAATAVGDQDNISSVPSHSPTLNDDPFSLRPRKRENITTKEIHSDHSQWKGPRPKKIKKYYNRQILSKECLFVYCFLLLRYPAARIFMIDQRNDIVVNVFGLIMSIIGTKFGNLWFLDPVGAICIALIILVSWASTEFEHMWLLVGRSAPREFLNKLVYVAITHDRRILKIETAREYTAGEKYYVEVDVTMDPDESLRITHDVSQTLQRRLEGLADVERAFVHVDYNAEHEIGEEHKPLYEIEEPKGPVLTRIKEKLTFSKKPGVATVGTVAD